MKLPFYFGWITVKCYTQGHGYEHCIVIEYSYEIVEYAND